MSDSEPTAEMAAARAPGASSPRPAGDAFSVSTLPLSARRAGAGGLDTARVAPSISSSALNTSLEKEVYEYIPDPAVSLAPQTSQADALSGAPVRAFRAKSCDVDEESLEPGVAFETFRGKTYKTTQFDQGFAKQPTMRRRMTRAFETMADFELSPAASQRGGESVQHVSSMSIFELGNTCFETPLGRLQRLRMEVEEMLDFVSSFIVRERVNDDGDAEAKDAETNGGPVLRTMYTQKILTPEEKQTLLFGRDPVSLMGELDCLRMQILSVMNDPSLQRLLAGVEPTTGKKSGSQLLLQHLSQVQQNLQTVASACTKEAGDAPAEQKKEDQEKAAEPQGDTGAARVVAGSTGSTGEAANAGTTQYDIYCVPSLRPLLESSRVATLERRLAQVEGRIGMSSISLLPFADLQQAVTAISQKISLLDQAKIEQLHKRTQSLLHELHALQHRRREMDSHVAPQLDRHGDSEGRNSDGGRDAKGGSRAGAGDDQRVEDMFDLCERWKSAAAALPSVVERLRALKTLHQEAGGISVRLGVIEEQQGELQSMLTSAEENVERLQQTVMETVAWARNTVEALQWRLQRLEHGDETERSTKSATNREKGKLKEELTKSKGDKELKPMAAGQADAEKENKGGEAIEPVEKAKAEAAGTQEDAGAAVRPEEKEDATDAAEAPAEES
ncbi:hypothetical protein BESB_006220 [Besnoitia besnoiti]|uniref:Dynamitin n=1 Tax=Besnoitia besnoiti TaxID=94643 RepID=A0A2A9MNV2_BESBE|nr:hypothetical protein BESB_006220 [Besnoitia besnoiti]PFH38281.1 hypothetical protein BESB_006220 [Besnoitia besnoiti]